MVIKSWIDVMKNGVLLGDSLGDDAWIPGGEGRNEVSVFQVPSLQ